MKAHIRVKSVFLMLESYKYIFFRAATALSGLGLPHYRSFTNTLHTTFGSNHLDEWHSRRRDLYLITQSTHKKQISTPPAGFETALPASERPETRALDSAATGIGTKQTHICSKCRLIMSFVLLVSGTFDWQDTTLKYVTPVLLYFRSLRI